MQSNETKNDHYDDDAVTESEDDDSGSQRAQRFPLDKAMEDTEKKEKWSDCRKVAWEKQESNPNAHYYRFLLRDEKQSKGSWTDEEHKLFMRRTLDIGVNYKWGLFSTAIPGRVGYVCSRHWAALIKKGKVEDMNFFNLTRLQRNGNSNGRMVAKALMHRQCAPSIRLKLLMIHPIFGQIYQRNTQNEMYITCAFQIH